MFVGNRDEVLGEPQVGWLDHPDYEAASAAGAINLHQSTDLLKDVVWLCVNGVFSLIEQGQRDPKSIELVGDALLVAPVPRAAMWKD